MGFGLGSHPPLRTWMSFVDGENLTIRAQEFARRTNLKLIESRYYKQDCFVWPPNFRGQQSLGGSLPQLEPNAIRASYYTSIVGDYPQVDSVRDSLRSLGFSPC